MFAFATRRPKLQVFGSGLPKTGTTSLARMFSKAFRCAHEQGQEILPHVCAYLNGEVDRDQVFKLLIHRIERLDLEVDVASYLCHFVEPLAKRYTEAKFVITVRHCVPWTVSLAHHMVARPLKKGSVWKEYRDARFGRYDERFAPEEHELEQQGYYPLRAMLRYWAEETERMLTEAPERRTLVLKTEELDASIERLSEFLEIPADSLRVAHVNRKRGDALGLRNIPDAFVLEQAKAICGPLMEQLYGTNWVDQAPSEFFGGQRSPA